MQTTLKGGPQGAPSEVHQVSFKTAATKSVGKALEEKLVAAGSAQPPPTATTAAPAASQATTETATAPVATKEPAAPLSPQFAALARQAQQLRKQQQEFKAAQEAWKQETGEYVSKKDIRDRTLDVLNQEGITYDKLVELQLANPTDPQQQLLNKITELETKLAATDKKFTERDSQRDIEGRQQAVAVIQNDVNLLVEADAAYETIKATKSQNEVVKLIESIFDEEGVVLTVEEAAKQIEEELVTQSVQKFQTLSQLNSIKAKLAPPTPPSQPEKDSPRPTLTNSLGSSKPLSARDRAIMAVEKVRTKS